MFIDTHCHLEDENFPLNISPRRILFPMIIQSDFANRDDFFIGGKGG